MKVKDSDGKEYEVTTLGKLKDGQKFYMKEDIEDRGMGFEYEKISETFLMSFCITPSGNRQHYHNTVDVCKI